MYTRLCYLLVVFVGATTPFAIKLGGSALTPIAGLSIRIMLALLVGWVIFSLFGTRLNFRRHWPVYLAASIGLFPNLVLVYTAVEYVSSGLVALLFGLQPFFSAVLMRPILGEPGLQPHRIFAILLALAGLALIVLDGNGPRVDNVTGVLLMLVSAILFSGSILWIKRLNRTLAVSPFEQTLGGMAFSLPGLLLSWWLLFGITPITFTQEAVLSLLYLSFVVSLAGFAAYYFILKHMAVETVALIPLITPVMAMLLGAVFLGETVTPNMGSGAVLLLLALAIHQRTWLILRAVKFPSR